MDGSPGAPPFLFRNGAPGSGGEDRGRQGVLSTPSPQSEVGNILAQAVEEVREEGEGTLCVYQTNYRIFEPAFVNPGGVSGAKYMENFRAINGDPALVPGLGDEAFYNTSPAYRTFFVRTGDAVYTFGVRGDAPDQGPSPEHVQAMEKALAEQLLNNLP